MKVRRSGRTVDLRNLPLDGFDMFLLAQLDGTLSVAELADVMPCDRAETIRRLNQLHRLDVVVLMPETTQERFDMAARPAMPQDDLDDEVATLRPPSKDNLEPVRVNHLASSSAAEDDAMTIRPPAPVPVHEMMRAAEEANGFRSTERTSGVVQKHVKVTFPNGEEARALRDRSVFSRATMVDADVQERARAFEEPLLPLGRQKG